MTREIYTLKKKISISSISCSLLFHNYHPAAGVFLLYPSSSAESDVVAEKAVFLDLKICDFSLK